MLVRKNEMKRMVRNSQTRAKKPHILAQKGIPALLLCLRHTLMGKAAMNSEHASVPWALMYAVQSFLCAKQGKKTYFRPMNC